MTKVSIDVEAFRQGSMTEFQKLYEQTSKFVYNVIYKMITDSKEAEDLTHDVYVKIYEKRQSLKHVEYIKAWVYRLAINHTKNSLKRKTWLINNKKEVEMFYKQQRSDQTAEKATEMQLLLAKIAMKYRLPIILKDIEDCSYEEIASMLNVPIGTVRSRLNRGRAQLKALYLKEYNHG